MDIYLVETDPVSFSQLTGYLPFVTKSRQNSIAKKRDDAARLNSLVSELLILSEITARTGIPRRKISFEKGTHGKPYLKGSELQFSLSHTDGAVCAAFSECGEIGVDIERQDRRVIERLYERILCEEERFHATSKADFLRAWVQKEAFLKRLGVGITRDLRGVNSLALPDTAAIECGDYFVGASGKGAKGAVVKRLGIGELLKRFPQSDEKP